MSTEGQVEGKYWIYPSGIAEFCDGSNLVDRGEIDIAREQIERSICDMLHMDYESYPERRICQSFGMAYQSYPKDGFYEEGHFEKWVVKEGWGLDPEQVSFSDELARRSPQTVDLYHSYQHEPLEYVMRELGWATVADDSIETRQFDLSARQRIAKAVEEILRSDERHEAIGDHVDADNFRFRVYGVPDYPELSMTLGQIASGVSLDAFARAKSYLLGDEEPEANETLRP